MSNVTISLSKIQKTKKVKIGNDTFNVRMPGAAESLDLAANNRQQGEVLDKLLEIQGKLTDPKTKKSDLQKMIDETDQLLEKIDKLRLWEISHYKDLITHDTDQKKVDKLLRTLSSDGMRQIIEITFGE